MNAIQFTLNGKPVSTTVRADAPAVDLIREIFGLMGTKIGCSIGRCGACTILVDGKSVNACLLMAWKLNGAEVITIEGLATLREGRVAIDSFSRGNAFQCGYCASGMMMALTAQLIRMPQSGSDDIREALGGNICRCTGYQSILRAAHDTVAALNAGKNS